MKMRLAFLAVLVLAAGCQHAVRSAASEFSDKSVSGDTLPVATQWTLDAAGVVSRVWWKREMAQSSGW
jgi:hypothetical protein